MHGAQEGAKARVYTVLQNMHESMWNWAKGEMEAAISFPWFI